MRLVRRKKKQGGSSKLQRIFNIPCFLSETHACWPTGCSTASHQAPLTALHSHTDVHGCPGESSHQRSSSSKSVRANERGHGLTGEIKGETKGETKGVPEKKKKNILYKRPPVTKRDLLLGLEMNSCWKHPTSLARDQGGAYL